MSKKQHIRLLLVEDNSTDGKQLKAAFADLKHVALSFSHVRLLADALKLLQRKTFDIVLLDLGLPDSEGIATFSKLHEQSPAVPVLVLAGTDDEAIAVQAVEEGAQDYLVKKQVASPLLARSIRYAIERSRLQQALAETRQKQQQEREFSGIDRLSKPPGTSVTAQLYSGSPLKETATEKFQSIVERYASLLDQAMELRFFKTEQDGEDDLQEIADELGFLRATPRDVIEIHSTALKQLVKDVPWQKAQAYLQEGRLTVLELMGYLTGFYRSHYPARKRKDLAHE